jgi:hypothetical protein
MKKEVRAVARGKQGKRVARTGTVRQWPASAEEALRRDDLARELLGICMQALKSYGLSEARVMQLAATAANEKFPSIPCSALVLSEAEQLSEIISKWGEDPHYWDDTGRPAVLAIAGQRHCFADLAREFFPKWEVLDVVKLGCEAHVLERVGVDKVARINNIVLFTGNSALMLAHTVRTVWWYLSTAHHNRHVNAAAGVGLPDRNAHVEIAAEDFAEFASFVRPQISALIETSERWLMQRCPSPKQRRRRTKLAGIEVFVFKA